LRIGDDREDAKCDGAAQQVAEGGAHTIWLGVETMEYPPSLGNLQVAGTIRPEGQFEDVRRALSARAT
jgi:hypothetical protein